MTRTIAYLSLIALALLALVVVGRFTADAVGNESAVAADGDAQTEPAVQPLEVGPFRYVGTASCAAAACHGNRDPARTATVGREYLVWTEDDPHSRSYATLYSSRSAEIARKLGLTNAYEARECTSCHTNDLTADQLTKAHRHTIQDGVSCESCHGPAEKWLAAHTRLEWRSLSADEKAEYAFHDTADLSTRAQACAACHVGSPGRDVNHDLIAAGHPRLNFELSAYHAMLPRHWNREKDKLENGPALEARLWSIGQAASCAAALELLAARAGDPQSPWPEFAEYDCFACHRDLRVEPRDGPGARSWGSWHTATLPLAQPEAPSLADELDTFREAMKSPYNRVDRDTVGPAAKELGERLMAAARENTPSQFSREALLQRLKRATDPAAEIRSWDDAAQRFLAAAALRQALVDVHKAEATAPPASLEQMAVQLDALRKSLAYPEGFDSPQDFDDAKRQEINSLFDALRSRLE